MKQIFLPGLLINSNIFKPLIKACPGEILHWAQPLKKESLSDYVNRFSKQFDGVDTENTNLVGFCYGGLVSLLLAEKIKFNSVVTINTIGDPSDLSSNFKHGVKVGTKMPKLLLKKWLQSNGLRSLNEKLNPAQTQLMQMCLDEIDYDLLYWGAQALADWSAKAPPQSLCPHLALHGEDNRMIKSPKGFETLKITEAGHLAPLTHAPEISQFLERFW